ncbi:glutamate racemase [Clostridium polyendosporum]|uniref:Glutamate racemase n=1 Tax=Clostridium polyendosporum TaxID=69208 RepID=A0A919VE90_9CLOT|nr:glutamate racemase [Clostridium polyendosporum]GIM28889.1 glutamate racemase [Clostridium polyendosporum]
MSKNDLTEKPIGFFDSGVGGLSVMKKAMEILPNEDYIYFGDSKNAPYGIKTVEEVKELSFNATEFLLSKRAKAVVVACNTATSAAIEDLRKVYSEIPIIGIEPALKPAVELNKKGKIVIMATPMTLAEKKFNKLMNKYNENTDIYPLPCAGLVEFIEKGTLSGEELSNFLEDKFSHLEKKEIASVVLGCTHYPFVKDEIKKVLGEDVSIIDGSEGTAKELKRRLQERNLLRKGRRIGTVEIYNSFDNEEIIELCYKLLK